MKIQHQKLGRKQPSLNSNKYSLRGQASEILLAPALPVKKVFLVYKRSVYQKYISETSHKTLKNLYQKKHYTAASVRTSHTEHSESLKKIKEILKDHGIKYKTDSRHSVKNLDDYDLILTVGGDGTFLRSSHLVKNQPMIGINSSPTESVGALCSFTSKNFAKKLEDVIEGKFKIELWPRMQIMINGKRIPTMATNDILFTNSSPAAMGRYFIKWGKVREEQKSSGIWIATSTGSSAAISAAGGVIVPRSDKRLQYIVREPYEGIFNPYKLTKGFIDSKKKFTIITKMIQSRIYIDGPTRYYDLNYGDEVNVKLAKEKLKVLV